MQWAPPPRCLNTPQQHQAPIGTPSASSFPRSLSPEATQWGQCLQRHHPWQLPFLTLEEHQTGLEALCHSTHLQHQGWAGPWARKGQWSCCQDQLVIAGTGHIRTAAPVLAEPALSVRLVPVARGTGATFIYYYQAGKQRGGERSRDVSWL